MSKKDSDSDQSPEQLELERRVDAMMDLNLPNPPAPKPAEPAKPVVAPAAKPKRIDIFSDIKTAPDVAPNLLKSLGLKEKPEPAPKPAEPEPKLAPAEPAPSVAETPSPRPPRVHHKAASPSPKSHHKQPTIDEAVDDIVLAESDKLLALQDATDRSKRIARDRRYKRAAIVALLIVIVLAIIAYPAHLI